MTFNITFTVRNERKYCIAYGHTRLEAQARTVRQVCRSFHCDKSDVVIEKVTKR